MKRLFYFYFLLFFSCSTDYFKEAEVLDKQGKFLEAARYYEMFADKNPQHALADISLYRAALIYSEKFEMCSKSLKIFERLVRDYPKSRFRNDSYSRAFICPDYFPINKISKWYYGDSQSYGKNARENIFIKKRYENIEFLADYFLYAGNKLIDKNQIKYIFKDLSFWELSGKDRKLLLKYPIRKDDLWQSISNMIYKVMDTSVNVKVKAGNFENCIKIAQYQEKSNYKMIYYYAPDIGRVLTTIETNGKENRIMELLKYD